MARTTGIAKLCSTLTIRKIVSILTEEVILMEVAEHRITCCLDGHLGLYIFGKCKDARMEREGKVGSARGSTSVRPAVDTDGTNPKRDYQHVCRQNERLAI